MRWAEFCRGHTLGELIGQTKLAEFTALFIGGSPEVAGAINGRRTECVNRDHRRHGSAVWHHIRRSAQSALECGGCRAGAGPNGPYRNVRRQCLTGCLAKCAIRRIRPILVSAVHQVKQDCSRDNRHPVGAHLKTTALRAQPVNHARRRIKAERRTTRQHQRVDLFDRFVRCQQIGFAGSRRAAHDMYAASKRCIPNHDRSACFDVVILRMADHKARNIRQRVLGAGDHGRSTNRAPR